MRQYPNKIVRKLYKMIMGIQKADERIEMSSNISLDQYRHYRDLFVFAQVSIDGAIKRMDRYIENIKNRGYAKKNNAK